MVIDTNGIDNKSRPPVHALMTDSEKIACRNFLTALEIEFEETKRKFSSLETVGGEQYIQGQFIYWQHCAAAMRLARSRLGVPERNR